MRCIGSDVWFVRSFRRTPCLGLLVLWAGAGACRGSDSRPANEAIDAPSPVRLVRVLIGSKVAQCRVRSETPLTLVDSSGRVLGRNSADVLLTIQPGDPHSIRVGSRVIPAESIILEAAEDSPIHLSIEREGKWAEGIDYAGRLRVEVVEAGSIDLVNLVAVEQYVACVVAYEMWPSFAQEAYRVGAIVARTYVLLQMQRRARREDSAYDIAATEGSQVYRGLRIDGPGRRATEAARDTRGVVCTWRDDGEDRLFSTYYSAVCGGMSQSAAIFGKGDEVPPLRGGVVCDYCKIAPGETYRWGPLRLSCDDVVARLVSRYPELVSLGGIRAIEAIERTPASRPVRLRITGSNGTTHDILAERFRLAMGSRVVRSTDFDIRVEKDEVIFENGRGFGHGLGLCQWGAQGQALAGKRAGEILRYYYPGSRLTRVY